MHDSTRAARSDLGFPLLVATLRGVGQIYLQRSALSGALFLAAIAVASWRLVLVALAGSAVGTVTARVLRARDADLDDGLYGFNAALVALAGGVFFRAGLTPVVLTGAGAALSTLLFHVAVRRGWAVFTAPFVLVTMVLLRLLPAEAAPFAPMHHLAEVLARQFGQVIFLDRTVSGALCLAGVFAGGVRSGLAALAASLLVVALGVTLPANLDLLHAGLYGFNAVLVAIALHQQRPRWPETLAGALLATVLTAVAAAAGARVLTAPFVVVAWLGTRRRLPSPHVAPNMMT